MKHQAGGRNPQLQGIPASRLAQLLPSTLGAGRGGSTQSARCARLALGVAVPRRALSAVDNGDGLEEKGNLQREAAAAGRERGRRVHFDSGVSARRLQRELARERRGSRSPISGRLEEGSERADTSAPAGRGAGEPGQRGKPRGARPGRAPGAAQDAPRGAAFPAETPLWL